MNEAKTTLLVAEKEALSLYLDALLREDLESLDGLELEQQAVIETAPVPVPDQVVEAVGEPVPEWGQKRFQAVLFKVAGLTLAVPLIQLSGVQEWEAKRVTPLPGHISWYLGLMQYRERNVPVVDTAQIVLPPDRLARLTPYAERLQRVVFIDEGRWGLACDEVAEVITLEPDQVRWRSSRTLRRWLAGTVIEKMCALLDPDAFAVGLANGIEEERAGVEKSEAMTVESPVTR